MVSRDSREVAQRQGGPGGPLNLTLRTDRFNDGRRGDSRNDLCRGPATGGAHYAAVTNQLRKSSLTPSHNSLTNDRLRTISVPGESLTLFHTAPTNAITSDGH